MFFKDLNALNQVRGVFAVNGVKTFINKGISQKLLYGKRMANVWQAYGNFSGFGGLMVRTAKSIYWLNVSRADNARQAIV